MALLFAAKRALLALLPLFATAGTVPEGDGCSCEAICGHIVAQQREENASLRAEIRTLHGATPAARRAAAPAVSCGGDWVIASNADVQAYQGCSTADSVTIQGAVTSLAGLQWLESAENVTIVETSNLKSLIGLGNLSRVGVRLEIRSNDKLPSLKELQRLHTAGMIVIMQNAKLRSLTGLQGLSTVGSMQIGENPNLKSLTDFQHLMNVDVLEINANPQLRSLIGFEHLMTTGVLNILGDVNDYDGLAGLENLAGLESLTSAGRMWIWGNHKLGSLTGLQGLEIVAFLGISSNSQLASLYALENLRRVDEQLLIERNYGVSGNKKAFLDLPGLRRLQTVKELRIEDNFDLLDIAGFGALTSADRISIIGSGDLETISGFENLTAVGSLTIDANGLTRIQGFQNLRTANEIHLLNNHELRSILGFTSLLSVDGVLRMHNNPELWSLRGLRVLTRVGVFEITEISRPSAPRSSVSLAGLTSLTTIGEFTLENTEIDSLSGPQSLRTAGRLWLKDNDHLVSLAGLASLENVSTELLITNSPLLHSLDGLEGLRNVEDLTLKDLQTLGSLAALRGLANAWGRISIQNCGRGRLSSLESLGGLSAPLLAVEASPLDYLGGPLAANGAAAVVIRIDDASWPRCVTLHEHTALVSVAVGVSSSIPPMETWPWDNHKSQCARGSFGTFNCTRGHPCNFSLAGRPRNYTSIFISGRFTGCGLCYGDRPQGSVAEDGTVDLGYALDDEEGGLRSVCRCAGGVELGPVAQLSLRGPRQSGTTVCRSGQSCSLKLHGEALEPTDHVVLMSDCSKGNPLSGYAASRVAENLYLLHDPATWYVAPRTRYQVCWRAPCSSAVDGPTCPAPEDRYLAIGHVELLGVFPRNYTLVLGEFFSAPNIGFGVSDGDKMRLRRACGEANEEGTDILDTNSSGLLFDFGSLTEDRVRAGSHRLCWCQEHTGAECNADRHFLAASGDVQILCPAGKGFVPSSGRCQECPAGRQRLGPGLEPCSECPAGQSSPGRGETCEACQEGTVAKTPGSSACATCRSWERADVEAAGCSANPALLVLLAAFYLYVGTLCAVLVQITRRRLVVMDVSIDQKCTVVTTFGSHGFSNFGRLSFPVSFRNTGHPGLDKPSEPFRASVRDAARLELLTWAGASIDSRLDTSMGTLEVPFPHGLYHQGWPVSMSFSLPALLIAVVALGGLVLGIGMIAPGLLGATAAALAFTAASAAVRWRPRTTPLAQRVSEFRCVLAKQPPTLCAKGPCRAIAVGKLHELLAAFRDVIRDRTAYYLDSNLLQPLCKEKQVSYAELAGCGEVEWFVSHFWGTAFEHFCMALQKHAETVCGDRQWASLRYWVCFCSNNQFRIKAELGEGWEESSFYITLKSGRCQGTCMVLDDKALPLTRVWCIFEVLQTVKLERDEGIFQGLLLCTSSGVLNTGKGSVDVAMALAQKVAQMDLGKAQASSESDALMIRAQVIKEMGSYDNLNHFIRGKVRSMLVRAQASANQQFTAVIAHLDDDPEGAGQIAEV